MDLSIINEIANKCSVEAILRNCKKINKRFSLKSAKDTGCVAELVILLYICNMFEDAIKVCDLLNEIKFNGNYTLWDNVVNARLVKSRIFRDLGKEDEAYELIEEVMVHEIQELWNNQVACLNLYDKNITEANERNSNKDILSWQLIKYEMMIRFAELPSFPLDKEKLNNEIRELTIVLRKKLICKEV